MNENDDNEKNKTFYHMHVHPRNDSCAELVLANIYYFIDVSLKKGVRGVMFLTFFFKQKQIVLYYLIKD